MKSKCVPIVERSIRPHGRLGPLCGMNEAEAQKAREEADFGTAAPPAVGHSAPVPKGGRKKGGARVAKKQRGADRIPTWMTVLICIILAIALFIGIVFAVTSIRSMVSAKTPNLPAGDDVVSLPGATDDLNGQGTRSRIRIRTLRLTRIRIRMRRTT